MVRSRDVVNNETVNNNESCSVSSSLNEVPILESKFDYDENTTVGEINFSQFKSWLEGSIRQVVKGSFYPNDTRKKRRC